MPREVQTVKKDPFALSPPCEQLTDLQIARNVHTMRTGLFYGVKYRYRILQAYISRKQGKLSHEKKLYPILSYWLARDPHNNSSL